MSTQHTPGDWTVFDSGSDLDFPGIEAGDSFSIVCFGGGDDPNDMCGVRGRTLDEAWANARLFCAAPELLKALRDTLLLARLKWGNLDDVANEIFAQADAAIAKATTP
jgi:hypothetical protein